MSLAAHKRSSVALAIRTVSAIGGGYLVAAGATALMARFLPGARVDASAWGLVTSFAVFAAVLLWSFAEPRLPRVLVGAWGGGAALAAAVLVSGPRP